MSNTPALDSIARDVRRRKVLDATEITTMQEARATGASLVDYVNTTRAVREWCRAEGVGRAMEAYVVEGFLHQRKLDGLSENV